MHLLRQMAVRIEYDRTEGPKRRPLREKKGTPNPLRQSPAWRQPGRRSFRYTRRAIAAAVGLEDKSIYTAERRGELVVSDLVSVARFIVRRVERAERSKRRRRPRPPSVNPERP